MKFRHLELYRVGRYNGAALQDINDGLTVVYGENEAGKSTMLSGIRGLLFGKIPPADVFVSTEPGAFGKLAFETEGGDRVTLERTLHRKSPPKVTLADGSERHGIDSLHAVAPELLHVEELLYNAVFTLQLRDLREFSSSARNVQDKLYAVGMMGSVSPLALEAELSTAAKNIFNPHKAARNPRLVQCLLELGEVEAQLRQANDSPEAFRKLERSKVILQQDLAGARDALSAEQKTLWRLRRLRDMLPDFQDLRALDAQVAALLPPLGQQEAVDSNVGQDATMEQVLTTVNGIGALLVTHQALSERRQEFVARIRTSESQMEDVLKRLSDVWTVHEVMNVDIRAQRMVELRAHARNLDTCKSLHRQSADAWAETIRDKRIAAEALAAKLDVPIEEVTARLNDWAEAQQVAEAQVLRDETRIQTWSKVDDQARQLAAAQFQVKTPNRPSLNDLPRMRSGEALTGIGIALLLVFVGVAGFVHQGLAVGGAALAIALLALLWGLQKRWYGRVQVAMRETGAQDGFARVEAQISMLHAEQKGLVRAFERVRPQGDEADTLLGLQTALHRAKREVAGMTQAIRSAQTSLENWSHRAELEKRFAQKTREAAANMERATESWQVTVQVLFGKLIVIDPDVLFDDVVRVENWRRLNESHMAETKRLDSTTTKLRAVQCELLEHVQSFSQSAFASANPDYAEMMMNCPRDPAIEPSALTVYRSNVETVARGLQGMVNAYRDRRMSEQENRVKREQTRAMVWGRLRAKSTTDEQFSEDMATLETLLPDELDAQIKTAEHTVEHAAHVLEEMKKDLWRIEETMLKMDGNEHTEDLIWRQAQLRSERRTLAFDWASVVIAKSLVGEARIRYEQTQQPPAIQEASRWLEDITDGRYVALVARADAAASGSEAKAGIYACDRHGVWWDAARLSRGTQELVYFALRLGLVKTYALRNIVLPMVLDDPMVNFDDVRTRKFFQVLTNVAQGHQMIYFTCHRKIAELAENHGQAQLLTLEAVN